MHTVIVRVCNGAKPNADMNCKYHRGNLLFLVLFCARKTLGCYESDTGKERFTHEGIISSPRFIFFYFYRANFLMASALRIPSRDILKICTRFVSCKKYTHAFTTLPSLHLLSSAYDCSILFKFKILNFFY